MELPFTVARPRAKGWQWGNRAAMTAIPQAPVHSLGCLDSAEAVSGCYVSNLRESLHDLVVWRMGGVESAWDVLMAWLVFGKLYGSHAKLSTAKGSTLSVRIRKGWGHTRIKYIKILYDSVLHWQPNRTPQEDKPSWSQTCQVEPYRFQLWEAAIPRKVSLVVGSITVCECPSASGSTSHLACLLCGHCLVDNIAVGEPIS